VSAPPSPGPTPSDEPRAVDAGSPPGPKGLPFFGNLRELRANTMDFHARLAREYGGIVRFWYGRKPSYLVTDPALIRELLIDKRDKYVKMQRYPQMRAFLGEGLILSEGEKWRRQRLITQLDYKPRRLEEQIELLGPLVAEHLAGWRRHARSGKPFDLYADFLRLTQQLSGVLLVGDRYMRYARELFETTEVIRRNWPEPPRGLLGSYRPPPLLKIARLKSALARLDHAFYELARTRHEAPEGEGGILETLWRTSEAEGAPFSDKELRDQIITLFYAGYETTAAGMSWAHYLLSLHSDARERMRDEIARVVPDRIPSPADLGELHYTEQVLQEALRLYAPIHALGRTAIEDNTIGGYLIPKGATVTVSFYATHRLEKYWPDPERFDPERFSPEAVAARPRLAYMPFAAGHRNCIGANLAMLEGKLIMALVAQRYRLDLVPGHRVETASTTTMHPRWGMMMTAKEW